VGIQDEVGYKDEWWKLEPDSMLRRARFEEAHADPFDRMIAAQANQNNRPRLGTETRLDAVGIRRLKPPKL
jgi:PIN domain nuclease of toxin-antitoxin system